MVEVRPAVIADTAELVRLRGVILAGMRGTVPEPGPWQQLAARTLRRRLGAPGNPTGESGYVFNVVTEPGHRRRGYARACVEWLLDWYRGRGIPVVDLRPSPDGKALYRSLGFTPSSTPVLRLDNRNR